jgi:hypothetical protein
MKLIVTFLHDHLAFLKQERNPEKRKTCHIVPGQYIVSQTESKTDTNFYRFSHPDFYFEFEKSSWNNPDFLKDKGIKVQKLSKTRRADLLLQ